jgi:hypothetical protein
MMRLATLALCAAVFPASAADKTLVLNDSEQAALRKVLDSAVRHDGLELAPTVTYLLNKLNSAPSKPEQQEPPAKGE